MTDTNEKSNKGFFEQLDAVQIKTCDKELELDKDTVRKFTFMRPQQTLADLYFVMNGGRTERDIPIMEERNKELIGIISLVDLVRFLPPGDKLPKKYFAEKQQQLTDLDKAVNTFIKENQSITIEKAFEEQIQKFSDRFQAQDNNACILDDRPLNSLFQSLIDATNGEIKYRTLPIVKPDTHNKGVLKVRRMWSYIDALKLIKEKGNASFLKETVDKVCTKSVYTLKQDNTLSQAFLNLQQLQFYPTHLPITAEGGFTTCKTHVTGIVDEVLINTLQHDIFGQDLAAMPINYIATPINRHEIVQLDTTIGDLIQILITRYTKPTAILVGDYQAPNEFKMDGIVNYVDLFNRILEWAKET
jgi:hypothetical protein